jgi:hypothetical protein
MVHGLWRPETEQALAVFADAIAAGDRQTANVHFDLTAIAPIESDSVRNAIVEQLRRIGGRRLLFGIDLADSAAQVRERWTRLMDFPFSMEERRAISANVAPYMRRTEMPMSRRVAGTWFAPQHRMEELA